MAKAPKSILYRRRNIGAEVKLTVFLVVTGLPTLLFAQVDFGGDGDQVYDVPFDDGVFVLVALAIVYGVYKVVAFKKSKKQLLQ